MIGWLEARQRLVPRPTRYVPLDERFTSNVPARSEPRLKLRIYWHRVALGWVWRVAESDAHHPFDVGVADTHAEALAVGLAALEAASVVHA